MAEDKTYTLEELKDKLTEKENAFCHFYIIEWNGSDSARKAGYSENTCAEIASENLRKPHIMQYIDFIKDDIAKEAGISKLKIINRLTGIAFANITDMFDVVNGSIVLKNTDKPLSSLPKEITDNIAELQDTPQGIKVKMYCGDAAAINLLKAMGWNEPDKLEHSGEIKGTESKINLVVDGKTFNLKEESKE